jgi:DNA repair exonuclease SbcCD ATPase subunit
MNMRQNRFADNRDVLIKTIKLENFQAHTDTGVSVSPGITTIKGATDKGKSAILRAIGWCCLNNVSGAEFVKEGSKQASVTITTDNAVVKRDRGASGKLNTYEMDGEEYKAFGTGVPEDIADRLGLDSINFQNQHDPPFWFSETAGEVSRKLNAVIDLSVIDSSLAAALHNVKRYESRKVLCQQQLEEIKEELEVIESQRDRVTEFRALEKLCERKDELEENSNTLGALIETVRANRSKTHTAQNEDAVAVLELADKANGFSKYTLPLKWLIQKAEDATARSIPPPPFIGIKEAFRKWQLTASDILDLKWIIREIREANIHASTNAAIQQQAEMNFHLKTQGAPCPLCGNLIE